MKKTKKLSASLPIEVAIGSALAIIAVLVVIGLFNDNLANMVSDVKSRIFNTDNSEKTAFAMYNRDYSGSQMNVQITGEQGLEMIRKKANNRAIDLIENPFDINNQNAPDIGYAGKIIEIIMGEPHICVWMKKESKARCDTPEIGGYKYYLTLNASAVIIDRVSPSKTVTMYYGDSVIGQDIMGIGGYSDNMTMEDQYSKIRDLTDKLKDVINKSSLVINPNKTQTYASSQLREELRDLLWKLNNSLLEASDKCKYGQNLSKISSNNCCEGARKEGPLEGSQQYICWVNTVMTGQIPYTTGAKAQLVNERAIDAQLINDLFNDKDYINIMRSDHCTSNEFSDGRPYITCGGRKTTCEVLQEELGKIKSKYSLNIYIPVCTPRSGTDKEQYGNSVPIL